IRQVGRAAHLELAAQQIDRGRPCDIGVGVWRRECRKWGWGAGLRVYTHQWERQQQNKQKQDFDAGHDFPLLCSKYSTAECWKRAGFKPAPTVPDKLARARAAV